MIYLTAILRRLTSYYMALYLELILPSGRTTRSMMWVSQRLMVILAHLGCATQHILQLLQGLSATTVRLTRRIGSSFSRDLPLEESGSTTPTTSLMTLHIKAAQEYLRSAKLDMLAMQPGLSLMTKPIGPSWSISVQPTSQLRRLYRTHQQADLLPPTSNRPWTRSSHRSSLSIT